MRPQCRSLQVSGESCTSRVIAVSFVLRAWTARRGRSSTVPSRHAGEEIREFAASGL